MGLVLLKAKLESGPSLVVASQTLEYGALRRGWACLYASYTIHISQQTTRACTWEGEYGRVSLPVRVCKSTAEREMIKCKEPPPQKKTRVSAHVYASFFRVDGHVYLAYRL